MVSALPSVAHLPPYTDRTNTEKLNSILFEPMNGNGKLTAAENVIFCVSYRVLTDKRNSYLGLFFETEYGDTDMDERIRNDGNHA